MDATYKLLEIRLPVYILLCEDGAGESEIAAVGLLAREDAASLSWFIERFKSYNISWPKTNVFMTDKDLNERDVLRGAFPGVSLLLCLFHTLRTFSREITTAKLGITSGERISSLEFIQKLAYATSEKNYDELYRLFVSSAPSTVIDYYNNNWHNIHDEWVFGLKFVSRNLMNSTNNRLENFNGKLKEVIDCNSSLENFLDKFYVVLTSMRNERDHRTIFQMQKVSVDVFDPNSAEAAYKKVLTLYAARHVLKQMSLFKEIILLPGEHGQFIVNSHEGSHIVTSNFCSCMFRKSMNLPCRHIFAARQLLGINLFDTELCSERWTLKYYRQHQRAFSTQVTDGKPGAVDFHVAPKVKVHSQHEKFKLAIQETSLLATLVSESTGHTLEQRLSLLRTLSKGWSDGKVMVLNELIEEDDLVTCEQISKQTGISSHTSIAATLVFSDVNLTTFSAVGTVNSTCLPVSVDVSTLQAGICSTSSSTTVSASKNVASTYSINSLECAAHVNDEVTLIVPKVLNKESISVSQIGAQYEIINNKFLSEQAEIAEKEPYQQEELTSGKSDADSYLAQIHVPKRVKHCGRPKGSTLTTIGLPKKRQRQLHEGLVPFLKLHPSKRHAMMLGWFLKPDDVQKALSGILIQSSCIEKRVNCISSAILDESALGSLLSLQSYFTADGWKVLNEIIDVKCQQRIWPCALCQKSTSVGNDIGGSIACDSCLLWFHKKCVGKKEGWFIKSKYWFCRFCSTV
ncbi:uncharacterized protein LOC124816284 isoform X2 [Hydra vulgaris]|uniref:uncharacterized protein LOC124816284 isoform X2 n=1 Tax=Hydra vulgaris TaxID=6087 RepID=UPI0032E9C983